MPVEIRFVWEPTVLVRLRDRPRLDRLDVRDGSTAEADSVIP
jgi:hypothetical protein